MKCVKIVLVVAAITLGASVSAFALTTNWTAGTASWHTAGNWDNGVPVAGDNAYVANRGTAQITSTADCRYLGIDSNSYTNSSDVQQSGGTFTISDQLHLADGFGKSEYSLSGGQLSVGNDVYIAKYGRAYFHHSAGTATVDGAMYFAYLEQGDGTYNLSGTGQLSAATQYIGYKGEGDFHHTGGTNTVTNLYLSYYSGSDGVYNLGNYSGAGTGTLTAVNEYIGGSVTGRFYHYAGTNEVSGTLRIGYYGDNDTFYNLYENAVLEVENLSVFHYAILDIKNSGASIAVNGIMTFETNAEYAAAAGSTIHMTGADFRNKSTSSSNVGGLGNTEFVFEGGVGVTDTFEAAGLVDGGFVDNFALNALTLGGADEGHLQLVDTYNNGNRGTEGAECLFLDDLTIDADSSLDVNGFWLYESGNHATEWHNMIIDGRLFDSTGSLPAVSAVYDPVNDWTTFGIPEPGTIILIGCGLAGLAGILRRRLR